MTAAPAVEDPRCASARRTRGFEGRIECRCTSRLGPVCSTNGRRFVQNPCRGRRHGAAKTASQLHECVGQRPHSQGGSAGSNPVGGTKSRQDGADPAFCCPTRRRRPLGRSAGSAITKRNACRQRDATDARPARRPDTEATVPAIWGAGRREGGQPAGKRCANARYLVGAPSRSCMVNVTVKDRVTCIRPETEAVQTAAADPSLLTRSNDGPACERLPEPQARYQAERRRSAASVRAGGA